MIIQVDFSKEKQKRKLWDHLKTLRGKVWITTTKEARSVRLNSFYWGVIIPAFQSAMGELSPLSVHEDLTLILIPEFHRDYWNGFAFNRGRSSKLTNEQFCNYLERCRILYDVQFCDLDEGTGKRYDASLPMIGDAYEI